MLVDRIKLEKKKERKGGLMYVYVLVIRMNICMYERDRRKKENLEIYIYFHSRVLR